MPNKKTARRRPLTLEDVRAIALSMPEVEETTAYGMPAFKAGKTRFAGQPIERAGVDPGSLGVHMSFDERERRIASRPDVYYLIDHFVNYPAVLVRLANISRRELREILGVSWRFAMERQHPAKKKRPARAAPRGGPR
ncbi:MAG TPA: MmcQ/YjbR family DNA-binding protein [Gammaproteobacteria bacterium]|nr:MmcQ/YjbR family DNA-binding protein [Gammaproteobacteria bacterium]